MRHIILIILTYITCFPLLNGQVREVYSFEKIEQDMLALVNNAREEQGYRPLKFHPVLNDVALKHSQKMAMEGQLSHHFPNYKNLQERLMDTELPFIKSGENVAFSGDSDAKFIHDGFMSSTGHRQIILDPDFTHCGIKYVQVGKDFYVTEEFAQVYTLLTEGEMESLLEQDAAAWYREAFDSPLIFYSQLKSYARITSELSAREEKLNPYLDTLSEQWGRIQAMNVISPDQGKIKEALAKEFTSQKYSGTAIGVTFLRNSAYPGGAYSVSTLFVKGLQSDWTPEKFKQILLDEINRIRKENGYGLLMLDKRFNDVKFSAPTGDPSAWEKKFYRQLSAFYDKKFNDKIVGVKVFNYTSYDPHDIPANILDVLGKGNGALDKIGILAQRTKDKADVSNAAPVNYFMVMLIFAEA